MFWNPNLLVFTHLFPANFSIRHARPGIYFNYQTIRESWWLVYLCGWTPREFENGMGMNWKESWPEKAGRQPFRLTILRSKPISMVVWQAIKWTLYIIKSIPFATLMSYKGWGIIYDKRVMYYLLLDIHLLLHISWWEIFVGWIFICFFVSKI